MQAAPLLGMSARILVSAAGVITDSYSYKAFGEELQSGSGTVNAYRFVALALYYRELADLVNAWNNWLKSSFGRWDSRDKLGFESSFNPYGYVGNNPIMFFDPTGNVTFGGTKPDSCPAGVQKMINGACTCLTGLSQKDLGNINACQASWDRVHDRSIGRTQKCDLLTPAQMGCQQQSCGKQKVYCVDPGDTTMLPGATSNLGDQCDTGRIGGKTDPKPRQFDPGATTYLCTHTCQVAHNNFPPVPESYSPSALIFLHEMQHHCLGDTDKPFGSAYPDFCNDVIALCIYQVCLQKKSGGLPGPWPPKKDERNRQI